MNSRTNKRSRKKSLIRIPIQYSRTASIKNRTLSRRSRTGSRRSRTLSRRSRTRKTETRLTSSPRKTGRPKKLKQITFRPLNGKKIYCGSLEELPSHEYERFGTRRECLDIGFGAGRNTEYNYLRSLLLQEGYAIPERKRYD